MLVYQRVCPIHLAFVENQTFEQHHLIRPKENDMWFWMIPWVVFFSPKLPQLVDPHPHSPPEGMWKNYQWCPTFIHQYGFVWNLGAMSFFLHHRLTCYCMLLCHAAMLNHSDDFWNIPHVWTNPDQYTMGKTVWYSYCTCYDNLPIRCEAMGHSAFNQPTSGKRTPRVTYAWTNRVSPPNLMIESSHVRCCPCVLPIGKLTSLS